MKLQGLLAFDDRVDEKAESLSNEMSTEFNTYLTAVQPSISSTNQAVTTTSEDYAKLIKRFLTEIYKAKKVDKFLKA